MREPFYYALSTFFRLLAAFVLAHQACVVVGDIACEAGLVVLMVGKVDGFCLLRIMLPRHLQLI